MLVRLVVGNGATIDLRTRLSIIGGGDRRVDRLGQSSHVLCSWLTNTGSDDDSESALIIRTFIAYPFVVVVQLSPQHNVDEHDHDEPMG